MSKKIIYQCDVCGSIIKEYLEFEPKPTELEVYEVELPEATWDGEYTWEYKELCKDCYMSIKRTLINTMRELKNK